MPSADSTSGISSSSATSNLEPQLEPPLIIDSEELEQPALFARKQRQSKFVAHLMTYPAVAAATGFIGSFPIPKVFLSNAVPLLMAMKNTVQSDC